MTAQRLVCFSVLAATLVSCRLAFGQYEGLVINEILPNPRNAAGVYFDSNQDGATNVFDDEFIELLNTSTNSIDMAGFWITDAYTNIRRHVFSPRILPPGGSIVVFGGGSLLNFSNPPAQLATGGGLSLNNNDLETVHLYSPQTTQVDQVSYQLTASHDAISTVRNPDGTGEFTNHYLATTNTVRASPGRRVHGQPFLTNQPPVLVDWPDQTAFVGLELAFPVRAYDPADRDAIAMSVLGNPANSFLSSTGGVGTFSFTAAPDQVGQTYNVSFVASDVDGAETNTVSVQVINPNGAEDLWINEIHYENVGDDSDEGVEIAGTAGSVLTNYSLVLYNDTSGKAYDTNVLTGTLDNEQCGFGAAWFGYSFNGIQNGPSDGVALVKGTNVIQFLSYEGVLTASNGPASGMTSVDIGVHESDTTPVGYSLQLKGTGTVYTSFTWASATTNSYGILNVGQTITCLFPATIEIQKTVYLGHDGGASAPGLESVQGTNGAAVTYVFVVSNTGSSTITNAEIQDISLGITPITLGTLTGGEIRTAHVDTVVSGDLRNTATVSGYGPDGATVADEDTAEVVEFIPSIDIQLTVYRGHDGGASCPGSDFIQATNHTPVTFCLVVENNGNTNLNSLVISNASLGIGPISIGTLPSGGVFATSVASVVTASLTHVATVNGTDPNGDPVSDQDSAIVEIIHPAIQLQKSVYLGHDGGASCPGGELVADTNGAAITYCFQISNTGDTTLTNVVLSDAGLSGFSATNLGTLATGGSTSLFFESTLFMTYVNSATVTASTVIGGLVQDDDWAAVELSAPPVVSNNSEYTVIDLGTLGGTASEARGINDLGEIVGWSLDTNGFTQAFHWQSGSMTGLGFLPGATGSVANAINNNGIMTGQADVTPTIYHAVLYISNSVVDLGTLNGGPCSLARGINDHGDITGWSQTTNTSFHPQAVVWRSNQLIHIPPFSGIYSSEGYGINQQGRIAGNTFLFSPNLRVWAYVWYDDNGNGSNDYGEMKLLGSLGEKDSTGEYSGAYDINDAGQVVGWTDIGNIFGQPYHGFLVTPSNGRWKLPDSSDTNPSNSLMQDLGTLDRPTDISLANAINNQTWIVGTSSTSSGTNQAFLWRYGTMTNLNQLIPPDSGWVLTNATDINEFSDIVGSGLFHGQSRAFMLRPEGRITRVEPIFHQTGTWLSTNEQGEVSTQIEQHVETQVIYWSGVWGTNAITNTFTVEYCDALQNHVWTPCAPTSQWPITGTYWTNNDFEAVHMRFFRVRAK